MAQRQFRSDDTSKWMEGWGNGTDGALTISSHTTEAPIDASCSGTAAATLLAATNASFAAGQLILIYQSIGTGAGAWELNKISTYTAGTITLKYALCNTYTDSGASQAQVRVMKQYTNVTINSGINYTAKAWGGDVGGILAFFANGTTTVTGNILANGNAGATGVADHTAGGAGIGYSGGYASLTTSFPLSGDQGEGSSGFGTESNSANGTGGGGGRITTYAAASGAGGGNGAAGTSSATGTGGAEGGHAHLTTMLFGGGGGGGAKDYNGSNYSSGGGGGGGIVFIVSKTFTVTGTIQSIGGNGYTTGGKDSGGGGGAGGSVLLKTEVATLGTTLITATGGTAGSTGGNGAVGRIHLDYKTSTSGTTNPALDSDQDITLKYYPVGFIPFL